MLHTKRFNSLMLLVLILAACSVNETANIVERNQDQPIVQQAPGMQQESMALSNDAQLTDNKNIVSASVAANVSSNEEGSFSANVIIAYTETYMIVESNGIPSHDIGESTTPNTAQEQDFRFEIPINPQIADTITETPMGPIGIALSGAVFYNGFTADGFYAVELEILDHCGGHADQRGVYHYHEESDCILGNLMGYAFDGFELRKSIENDGSAVTDLDECNGHDHDGEYHYHATDDPSKPLIGCYSGVVVTSNTVG